MQHDTTHPSEVQSLPRSDEEVMPQSVRFVAWSFFFLNVGAVIWPGLTYFNRVEPLILGFPFVMVWLAGWLVASLIVLAWIEHQLHGLISDGDDA